MHLQEKTYDLDLGVLYHETYASAKFEAATSNSLGGDAFTRQYII